MVIGEAPGEDEDEQRKPFVGRTGKLTREMLSLARINPNHVYYSNIEKYRPPDNKLSKLKTVGKKPGQDIHILENEIEAKNPKCIFLLGDHALKFVGKRKGIRKWRGTIFATTIRGKEYKCVATYHPSALLRSESEETKTFSYSARAYMQLDFNRAVQQSKFRELRLPQRDLEYARSAEQFSRFLNYYRGCSKCSIDIETTKGTCIPTCIGFAFNSHHGMSVPLLNVGGGVETNDREQIELWRLVNSVLSNPEIEIIGQNFKFDARKLKKPCGFRFAHDDIYFDLGMCAHVLYPEFPKSLEFLTSVWTEEPYYKDELKEYDPSKESFEQILLYNAKDVCVPFEIHDKMVPELYERGLDEFFFGKIMPLHKFYSDLEDRGMEYDLAIRDELKAEFQQTAEELQLQINSLLGYELDIRKHARVKKALFEDLKLPKRSNTKEDTLVALMGNHVKNDPIKFAVLDAIIDLRKYHRLLDGPMQWEPDYDGKMRSACNINGAANGRTSFNIVKAPERPTRVGFQAHNVSKHGEIGPKIRRAFKPSPGMVFVQADKSQAEARVVAALAKDEWLLSLFERGKDVHSITASWFFGKENEDNPEDPIGIGKGERFVGKTGRHAMAYDAHGRKIMLTINKLARKFDIDINVSESEAKMFRWIFHKKSPKIREVYYAGVVEAYKRGGKKELIAASGRKRQFFGLFDPNLLYSYIPSASVSDDTKFGAVRVQKRVPQMRILLESHDAILIECYPSEVAEFAAIIKEEFEKPMDLSRCSLPRDPIIIPCDIEIGDNYKDLEKWKIAA